MKASFTTLAGWHDVFHEILSHLEPDYDVDDDDDGKIYLASSQACRKATISLALSCRVFLEPCLNKLWCGLDDIHPLLKLLPNYQRRGDDSTHWHVAGEISPQAWTRLQTYANRVRAFSFFPKTNTSIDPLVWQTVLKQCQGTLLFPNLQTLSSKLRNPTLESLSPIRHLTSPSLRHLFLSINKAQDADSTAISTLLGLTLQEFSMRSPGLVWLGFFPYMTVGREHLTCLSRFTKIEHLHLSDHAPLDEDIFLSLANLQNLTHLHARIQFQDSTESTPGLLDIKDGFQKLMDLDLHCQPTHLERLMLKSSMPRLSALEFRLRPHLSDAFHSSFPIICRHIGQHMLTTFRVELGDFAHPPRHLMDLLEPLLPFANLQELEVLLDLHLPLRNEDLERLARAWPNLRALILAQSDLTMTNPDRVPGSVERPTLHGLVALAQGCPRLAKIAIPDLDASSVPPADSVPLIAHRARNLCIQNLVGAEEGEQQLAVAVVLDRLFPRLRLEPWGIEELPGHVGGNPNVHLGDSKRVSLLLRAMQLARGHYHVHGSGCIPVDV